MAKTARKHFVGDGWNITEDLFSPDFSRVAESVFSLGNEYMGSRGYLEEGTTAPSLLGSYLNGVYEYSPDTFATGYKGISTKSHFMVNAADYWKMEISVNGKPFDMASCAVENYSRNLSLKNGRLTRTVTWLADGVRLTMNFCRFLDMQNYHRAYQSVEFTADKSCILTLSAEINFNNPHGGSPSRWQQRKIFDNGLLCGTETSSQSAAVFMDATVGGAHSQKITMGDRCVRHGFELNLKPNKTYTFTRLVAVCVDKTGKDCSRQAQDELSKQIKEGYDGALARNEQYWADFWKRSDIEIVGDDENQQGIRFCIFQLQQTYHAADPTDNIGAKGLTGEAYGGQAFWDTESYCLPYYLFSNPDAAKCLLMYRYNTLSQAKARAKELDCAGACYPIATINGHESCNLWQHASLQMQPSTAVAYGIYHYVNVSGDTYFLYREGIEMLVEICRYLVTRGQWGADGKFGYFGVMGPDEFQMMVNHNTYTNYMAKKTFNYTLSVIADYPDKQKLTSRLGVSQTELDEWKRCADSMKILYDQKTLLYEQHEGFYNLPHIDIDSIPDSDFPLYSHWSYDRIYRNDMIKQPDVLMFQFLYNGDFSKECKLANYRYYEPRCIHESSLSPSVHSILACELGLMDKAVSFFGFATRLDLDDYNRNTCEGLHTTSISAAWLNIVYGFGGVRSDGNKLVINPCIPAIWKKYSFKLNYKGSNISVTVEPKKATISVVGGVVDAVVCGTEYKIKDTLTVSL
ncbi:MAG: family 65 glycosyl hydrolase [Clostridiales bacterium]|nr:family 65 glycosyl hydrolase [Clostridiales bacterium]